MAKKNKEKAASPETKPKTKTPKDPEETKNILRLLSVLAVLLATTAFLLQLFAVISHHWKWQETKLHPIISDNYRFPQPNVYEDSRMNQNYGLFSRRVKLYANNDILLHVRGSTRFPRLDDGEGPLHQCLSRTPTLRSIFKTCSREIASPKECHCRRHLYWNAVIVLEILALILLGIVQFLAALLTTQRQNPLKLAAAAVSFLAFLLLLAGLILILSYRKREICSFADAYPHIYHRLVNRFLNRTPNVPHSSSILRQVVRRQVQSAHKGYTLASNQYPFNDTHFLEYLHKEHAWIFKPYSLITPPITHKPLSKRRIAETTDSMDTVTAAPVFRRYGPPLNYKKVFENTSAGIGWSTFLSILAMILSLLLLLIFAFSWLQGKPLTQKVKKVTVTTAETEYTPALEEAATEVAKGVESSTISPDDDAQQHLLSSVVTTEDIGQGSNDSPGIQTESIVVQDVVIRDGQPVPQIIQE